MQIPRIKQMQRKTLGLFCCLLFSSLGSLAAQAKTVSEVAKDLLQISKAAESYHLKNQRWPQSFTELSDANLLTGMNIAREIRNKEYQVIQSQNRFGVGVLETIAKRSELSLYLPELTSFAGYNWFYTELSPNAIKEMQANRANDAASSVSNSGGAQGSSPKPNSQDYYEQLLPFVSNTKMIIEGKVFNPTN